MENFSLANVFTCSCIIDRLSVTSICPNDLYRIGRCSRREEMSNVDEITCAGNNESTLHRQRKNNMNSYSEESMFFFLLKNRSSNDVESSDRYQRIFIGTSNYSNRTKNGSPIENCRFYEGFSRTDDGAISQS